MLSGLVLKAVTKYKREEDSYYTLIYNVGRFYSIDTEKIANPDGNL